MKFLIFSLILLHYGTYGLNFHEYIDELVSYIDHLYRNHERFDDVSHTSSAWKSIPKPPNQNKIISELGIYIKTALANSKELLVNNKRNIVKKYPMQFLGVNTADILASPDFQDSSPLVFRKQLIHQHILPPDEGNPKEYSFLFERICPTFFRLPPAKEISFLTKKIGFRSLCDCPTWSRMSAKFRANVRPQSIQREYCNNIGDSSRFIPHADFHSDIVEKHMATTPRFLLEDTRFTDFEMNATINTHAIKHRYSKFTSAVDPILNVQFRALNLKIRHFVGRTKAHAEMQQSTFSFPRSNLLTFLAFSLQRQTWENRIIGSTKSKIYPATKYSLGQLIKSTLEKQFTHINVKVNRKLKYSYYKEASYYMVENLREDVDETYLSFDDYLIQKSLAQELSNAVLCFERRKVRKDIVQNTLLPDVHDADFLNFYTGAEDDNLDDAYIMGMKRGEGKLHKASYLKSTKGGRASLKTGVIAAASSAAIIGGSVAAAKAGKRGPTPAQSIPNLPKSTIKTPSLIPIIPPTSPMRKPVKVRTSPKPTTSEEVKTSKETTEDPFSHLGPGDPNKKVLIEIKSNWDTKDVLRLYIDYSRDKRKNTNEFEKFMERSHETGKIDDSTMEGANSWLKTYKDPRSRTRHFY
ncbi:hypothetical protein SNEBB_006728 [Seison nebaliae]|nr:hypothetical protein SNEBB_006728 [Seison nebaliae]